MSKLYCMYNSWPKGHLPSFVWKYLGGERLDRQCQITEIFMTYSLEICFQANSHWLGELGGTKQTPLKLSQQIWWYASTVEFFHQSFFSDNNGEMCITCTVFSRLNYKLLKKLQFHIPIWAFFFCLHWSVWACA